MPDLQETIERCLAAGRDDRLADGQLYLDAATLLKAQQEQIAELEAENNKLKSEVNYQDWQALYEMRAEQIAELESAQQWISVEDRLPEDGQLVLVYGNDSGTGEPYWETTSYSYYEGEPPYWRSIMGFDHEEEVTHWKPLPAAPQTEDK